MISIAMGTYNGERFLQQQLDSIAAQTLRPAELVVCDDGSTDGTMAILEAFAEKVSFPVDIHRNKSNLGFRANFMKCVDLCEGDLIAFSDQDDIWSPTKLERQAQALQDPNVLLSCHEATLVDQDGDDLGRFVNQLTHGGDFRSLKPFAFTVGFTQMFKAELTRFSHLWSTSIDQGHPDQPMAHDQFFFFLATVLGRIAFDSTPLALYRQHDSNAFGLSGNNRRNQDRLKEYEGLVLGATNRVEMIDAISSDKFKDAAVFYLAFAASAERRRRLYSERTIDSFVDLVKNLDYRIGNQWRFKLKGAVRDAMELIR